MPGKKRILLAIRDVFLARKLSAQFEANGFETVISATGLQACNLVDGGDFEAILISPKLEGMSGFQVAATARGSKHNAKKQLFLFLDEPTADANGPFVKQHNMLVVPYAEDPKKVFPTILQKIKKSDKNPYDAKVINAITVCIAETIAAQLGKAPEMGGPTIKATTLSLGDFSTIIALSGEDSRGSIAISFQEELLKLLGLKFLEGQEFEYDQKLLEDLAGEMGNLLCGNIKLKLSNLGIKVMIGLPKVVHGKGHSIRHMVSNRVIMIVFTHAHLGQQVKGSVEFCFVAAEGGLDAEASNTPSGDGNGGNILLF